MTEKEFPRPQIEPFPQRELSEAQSFDLTENDPEADLTEASASSELTVSQVITHYITKRRGIISLRLALMKCQSEEEKRAIFEESLHQLADLRAKNVITPRIFQNRLTTLLVLDDSRSGTERRGYVVIKSLLTQLLESEDPQEAAAGMSLVQAIGVKVMENKFDRLDLEWCTAERMTYYLRNSSNRVTGSMWVERLDGQIVGSLRDLENLWGMILEREEELEDDDYLTEVLTILYKNGDFEPRSAIRLALNVLYSHESDWAEQVFDRLGLLFNIEPSDDWMNQDE